MSAPRIGAVFALTILTAGCTTTIFAPTPVADTATLVKEFSSLIVPGGSASRDFELTAAGPIGITLKSTTPDGVMIGVGVGIPRSNGTCALSAAVETAAGTTAQITLTADTGTYCARVYDPGTLTAPVPFTISISRP
ncbi:MAG: hypothetical protein ABI983_04390 [Acidobacteriota bacterium]